MRTLLRWILLSAEIGCVCLAPAALTWAADAEPVPTHADSENNWGLVQPDNVTEEDYKVHSPAWGLGFQKLAQHAGVVCYVKFPDHPTDGYQNIWDFIVRELQPRDWLGAVAAHPGPLATAVQPFLDDHTIAGAVMLVATPDRIIDVEVLGYADPFTQRPMTENTVFRLASITKTFTAVSVMMLQYQGKLNVDDPVAKYLPEFKDQMVGAKQLDSTVAQRTSSHPLLIRELLSHMSGFTNTLRYDETLPLEQQSRDLAAEPLPFDPGTHYEYCNKNFAVLGRLVEAVSGTPYAGFISTNLTEPLGMKDTTFWPTAEQLGRLVNAYGSIDHEPWFTPRNIFSFDPSTPPTVPHPAGGILSTAADLASYGQMLLNGVCLTDADTFRNRPCGKCLQPRQRTSLIRTARTVTASASRPPVMLPKFRRWSVPAHSVTAVLGQRTSGSTRSRSW